MEEEKKKIACLFGTYDPIHIAHLTMATTCLNNGFEEVWFIPSYNPFKMEEDVTNFNHRYRMVLETILSYGLSKKIKYSAIETLLYNQFITDNDPTEFKGNSTYSVLKKLETEYPSNEFTLVIGGDCFVDLPKWMNYEKLIEEFNITLIDRGNNIVNLEEYDLSNYKQVTKIEMPLMNISSTVIREMVSQGKNITFLVPEIVKNYIQKYKLYKKQEYNENISSNFI